MVRSSLWRLEGIPEPTKIDIKTLPLGTLEEVKRKIMDVKKVTELHSLLSDTGFYSRFIWDNSVLLIVMDGSITKGQVDSLVLVNTSDISQFYLLYVQLYELFGVTLLDEDNKRFIPIREYKKMYI